MLFPNNVSLHVLNFIWAAPPRQKSIKRHWRQSGRHVCRGQSCSPLKKNRRGVKHAHCLCSSSVHTEGGWWWFAVENHRHTRFLTDGRPATTGSGKLYFNTGIRKQTRWEIFLCIVFDQNVVRLLSRSAGTEREQLKFFLTHCEIEMCNLVFVYSCLILIQYVDVVSMRIVNTHLNHVLDAARCGRFLRFSTLDSDCFCSIALSVLNSHPNPKAKPSLSGKVLRIAIL